MRNRLFLLIAIFALSVLSGCVSVKLDADRAPNTDLSKLKTFYVKKLPLDERGIEVKIADQLNLMGFSATYGAEDAPPTPVDAIITYEDRWMWDITMYMLELKISIRDPETGFMLASGFSYRTSLGRKPAEYMVKETLYKIFNKPMPPEEQKSK